MHCRFGVAHAEEHTEEGKVQHSMDALQVLTLLRSLTPVDMELMGVSGGVGSLSGLVFRDIPVLPAPARPTSIRKGLPVFSSHTHGYNRVAAGVKRLREEDLSDEAIANLRRDVHTSLANTLYPKPMFVGPSFRRAARPGQNMHKSIAEELPRKDGTLRGTCAGKRTGGCARSVATPDCWIRPDEVSCKYNTEEQ